MAEPISESTLPEEHRTSPGGVYEIRRRHISLALGGGKDTGAWGGGHPFDIELATIPPGKAGYPLHSHAAQTEHYIILHGRVCCAGRMAWSSPSPPATTSSVTPAKRISFSITAPPT